MLVVRAAGAGVSFAALLSYTCGGVLLAGALPLAYWAYAALSLRYELRRDELVVHWGVVEHVVPLRSIKRAVLGRNLPLPVVAGLQLPGLAIGRAAVDRVGRTTLYLRYRTPGDLVYLVTAREAVGLSLDETHPFVQALDRAQREAGSAGSHEGVRRNRLEQLAFWSDHRAIALGGAALLLAWLSLAIVFSRYQARPQAPLLHFPSTEAAHVGPRSELLQIPRAAFAWLAASAVLALALFGRSRLAAYLVLGGAVAAGALFVVAALGATG